MKEYEWIEEALLVSEELVEVEIPDDQISLVRTYLENGVHGTMTFKDGTELRTLERPWKGNARRISCIPEGTYKMRKRYSPLVSRLTKGRYELAWEIVDVPDRDYILVHQGNYVKDSEGCVLVGMSKGFQGDEPTVWSSRKAFEGFMDKMAERDVWEIVVKEENSTK